MCIQSVHTELLMMAIIDCSYKILSNYLKCVTQLMVTFVDGTARSEVAGQLHLTEETKYVQRERN